MPVLNLGKVRTVWQGTYNSATTYSIADGVDYLGSSYILKVASSLNVIPTNTTNWSLAASKGDTGAASTVVGPTGPTGPTGPASATYSISGTVLNITT